jgi:hypothetical protein
MPIGRSERCGEAVTRGDRRVVRNARNTVSAKRRAERFAVLARQSPLNAPDRELHRFRFRVALAGFAVTAAFASVDCSLRAPAGRSARLLYDPRRG